MARIPEPLLPVEPEGPSRRTLLVAIAIAAAGLFAVAVAVVVVFRGAPAPPAPAASAPAEAPAPVQGKPPTAKAKAGEIRDAGEERRARELYDRAEAFERSEPGEYEKRVAHWREVVTAFPTSSWARRADEHLRAASASLRAFLDREFESTRRDALSLAAAGHFVDAIETIQNYRNAQTRESLRRRADLEVGAIQNASRLAFNEASARARELSAKGDYPAAVALFDSLGTGGIPEVAARSKTAMDQLRIAAAAHARHAENRKGEELRRAFRQEAAPRILGLVRSRQYEEALRELSSASAASANPAMKDELAAERASVADASSFWEAFLKTLRGKTGQDAVLLLADGKRLTGRIARILADRIVVETGEGAAEAPLDRLHADLLVGWTLGKSLPAEEAVSYVKAALFFFCEGRDDLARLYLATARELGGRADDAEKVFREGFLRAAMSVRK
jgi:hypothetical protein